MHILSDQIPLYVEACSVGAENAVRRVLKVGLRVVADGGDDLVQRGEDLDSKLCGGGAKAPIWRKMMADVLNIEIDLPQTEEGPGYGAAMLAMVGCGQYASVKECADALVKTTATIEPDAKIAALYEEKYSRFRAIYPTMKPLFQILKED